jgi:uncharacterized protein YdhG (YjbR/CyaY superfamily)
MDTTPKFNNADEYISYFSEPVQKKLKKLRNAIKEASPEAEEIISYNMPAFRYYGMLAYYAAHKEHIGFYPGALISDKIFRNDTAGYETSKGTIKFPNEKDIPIRLVKKIIKFKTALNYEKFISKKKTGKKT